MIWTLVKTMLGGGIEMVRGWQERKKVKLENEIVLSQAANEAKIERLGKGQDADIAWENTALKNAGWKDDYWTIVLSIPCVFCFIPSMVGYVEEGFKALSACPDWYKWALLVAIGSSFGYRKLADFMSLKKGS